MNRAEKRRQSKLARKIKSEQQTSNIQQNLNLAIQHHSAGHLPEAEGIYQQILQINPKHPVALNLLGVVAHQTGDNDSAVEHLTKAISFHPNFAEAHSNLGLALQALGKLDEAVESYQRAISIQPNFAEAHSNLGLVFQDLGKPDEAVESYQRALAIEPDFAGTHDNLGTVLVELGRFDQAITSHQKALGIRPDFAESHYSLGNAFLVMGNLDGAVENYRKALVLNPNSAETYNGLWSALRAKCHDILFTSGSGSHIGRIIDDLPSSIETDIIRFQFEALLGGKSKEPWQRVLNNLQNAENKITRNGNEIVALLHFGRSGTGYFHSLLDGHPQVSTLPGVYLSGFFGREVWQTLNRKGVQGVPQEFSLLYKVLFDARNGKGIPPAFLDDTYARKSVGTKEGFVEMGPGRDTPLTLERSKFIKNLTRIISGLERLNYGKLFVAIHRAYEETLGNSFNAKGLIFYHLHKNDPYSMANFLTYFPKSKFLTIIRNPVQSCESWALSSLTNKPADEYKSYQKMISTIISMLNDLNPSSLQDQASVAVRLEDIKAKPKETMRRLCLYLGIEDAPSLYQSTMQGLKWWGDPSSSLYGRTHDTESWQDDPTRKKTGALFGAAD